mmetsp:Transcript_4932/g.17136  ORF Transcript_4932/g.17136 Transcript_4932/m.17136 type:complete len:479 (-) Transcript_4932:182-1618(-)
MDDRGVTLGPQGGLGARAGMIPGPRGGPPGGAGRMGAPPAPMSRDGPPAPKGGAASSADAGNGGGGGAAASAEAAGAAASGPPPPTPIPDDKFDEAKKTCSEYFLDDKDIGKLEEEMRAWHAPHKHGEWIEFIIATMGFEKKGMQWEPVRDALVALSSGDKPLLTSEHLVDGFSRIFNMLGEYLYDAPKAIEHVSFCLAPLVRDGLVELAELGAVLLKCAPTPEDEGLVREDGVSMRMVARLLLDVESIGGSMRSVWTKSGLSLEDFLGDEEQEAGVDAAIAKHKLSGLFPLLPVTKFLDEAASAGTSPGEIQAWLGENVPAQMAKSPELVALVARAVLAKAVPAEAPGGSWEKEPLAALADAAAGEAALLASVCKGDAAAELALLHAAQGFFHERGCAKKLLTRLFTDLSAAGVASRSAFLRWKDDVADDTPGRAEAVRDTVMCIMDIENLGDDKEDDAEEEDEAEDAEGSDEEEEE